MAGGIRFDFPVPERQLDKKGARLIAPGIKQGASPQQARLPRIEDMSRLSKKQLTDVLQHYGVMKPWDSMIADTSKYLERVSGIVEGDPRWKQEMDALLGSEQRALVSLSRRVSEKWSTLDAIDGNVKQELMWITHTDDSLCENCEDRGGEIKTFEEWSAEGLPGASVCLGGDQCRCELVPVD